VVERGRCLGGYASNVAVASAKLGDQLGLVSSVGGDFQSEGYGSYLKEIGVDLRSFKFFLMRNKMTELTGANGELCGCCNTVTNYYILKYQ